MIKRLAYRLLSVLVSILLLATQAAAMMWEINSYRFGVPTPTMTFLQCAAQNGTDGTTMSFLAQNTGTSASNRYILIGWQVVDASGTYSTNGVTLGGVSADIVHQTDNLNVDYWFNNGFAITANPAGSSADVVLTMSETVSAARICMWALTNVSPMPFDVVSKEGLGGAVISMSVNVPANGFVVGVCGNPNTSGTWTWTGGLTERLDNASSEMNMTAADYTNDAVADAPLTVTADPTFAADAGCTVASFGAPDTTTSIINFLQCAGSQTDASSYTFSSQNLSVPDSSRAILVAFGSRDSPSAYTTSGMTIAGNAATKLLDAGGPNEVSSGFFVLAVPTGNSAAVVATISEAIQTYQICMWAIYNVSDLTPLGAANFLVGTGNNHDVTVTTVANGVVASYCATEDTGSGAYTGWTGLTMNTTIEVSPGGTGSLRTTSADGNGAVGSFSCNSPGSGISNTSGSSVSFGAVPTSGDIFVGCDDLVGPGSTTLNFGTVSIGPAAANRTVVVVLANESNDTASSTTSMTIGGASAAEQVDVTPASRTSNLSIHSLAVTSGSTANITAVVSGTVNSGMGATVCVWAVYGLASATATDTAIASSATTLTLSVDTLAGGFAVGGCVTGTSAITWTWTGLTESVDAEFNGTSRSVASKSNTSVATPLSITCVANTGTTSVGGAAAFD